MSYDIYYEDLEGKQFQIEPLQEGGTQQLGGNTETWLNVTYNYSWYYYKHLDSEKGIRWLYGRHGSDCVKKLEEAIEPFKDHKPYDSDYWADTPGNCIRPLKIFLDWVKRFPEGVFRGD